MEASAATPRQISRSDGGCGSLVALATLLRRRALGCQGTASVL